MNNPILSLKERYNRKLKVYHRLAGFIDTPGLPEPIIEAKMPDVRRIMLELSDLLNRIQVFTREDVWNGFKQ